MWRLTASVMTGMALAAAGQDPLPSPDDPAIPLAPLRTSVLYELIEVEAADWRLWTADPANSILDPELRQYVRQLQDAAKANVAQMALVAGTVGERVKAASSDEFVYPSEENVESPLYPEGPVDVDSLSMRLFQVAFETRNVGASLEVEVSRDSERPQQLVVDAALEMVALTREVSYGSGLGEVTRPVFTTLQSTVSLKMAPRQPRLAGVYTAVGSAEEPGSNRVMLAFLTLDLVDLEAMPPAPATPGPVREPVSSFHLLLEWIEMEYAELAALLSGPGWEATGGELRASVQQLAAEGKAEVIHDLALPLEAGKRAGEKSIEELIYPNEYDPPSYDYLHASPAAFETRHLGVTVEAEPKPWLNLNGTLPLSLQAEHVALAGLRAWGPSDQPQSFPDFHKAQSILETCLPLGVSQLVATHQFAKAANPKRTDPRVLLFAKIEGLPGSGATALAAPWPGDEESALLRFVFQVIETTQGELDTELTTRGRSTAGPELWETLSSKGRIVETVVVTARPNTRASVKSGLELIYPGDYDPPYHYPGQVIVPPNPAAFETREMGLNIELEPSLAPGGAVQLRLAAEAVSLNRIKSYFKPEVTALIPEFHSQILTQSVPLRPDGKPILLGTTRPAPAGHGKPDDRIWVWFVRTAVSW